MDKTSAGIDIPTLKCCLTFYGGFVGEWYGQYIYFLCLNSLFFDIKTGMKYCENLEPIFMKKAKFFFQMR